ncbi:stage II sporulation protein P [Paenibacillus melissococcoides]|uniref:Stage II sporulation protein P n=1 Tax=Paenibacillus melissococcoides TaxID=2912268 RepID=A0ABN8UBJ3_9BACL|nr:MULTISPECIES: stage II sporulation protein P [Paenibacillus]MEB9895262.1 stage II sporulation protein P [Bacillus cereus]CAH8247405.1 stage II sporulation protein P [Paenibacillus melissococcoides]CAH8705243.1 stage II sporulation protein P [Paenibacillus melissococcoides]CAH8708465.1 stage II sporulation protein P [Paenibacillus melissococcoides]GIO79413.1 stage II sporulation protein P [Paenibacillus dendritiformis]
MFRTVNVAKWKQKWMQTLLMGRTFLLLSIASAMFFIVLGLGGLLEQKLDSSPLASMKGVAAQLSSRIFVDMLAMEMPNLPSGEGESSLTRTQIAQFLVQMATNVNPLDPKSLIAGEVPGLNSEQAIPLRLGTGNQSAKGPVDYPSPLAEETFPEHGGEPIEDAGGGAPPQTVQPGPPSDAEGSGPSSNLKDYVFIYHSHNRESWNPELKKESTNPNDAKINVTLVGKHLQKELQKRGIGAVHSNQDYASTIKGYSWNYSYKYSKQTVKQAMAEHQDLQFFFDIHRDALRRKDSTVEIDGTSYAQVYFVIGRGNPDWRENEKFAKEIHDRLEERYPGVSRGIWGKSTAQGNGEYNQSLSPNSVIMEIGGIDNTLEENYRTAEVLADLIAEIVREKTNAKPVMKPQNEQKRQAPERNTANRKNAPPAANG